MAKPEWLFGNRQLAILLSVMGFYFFSSAAFRGMPSGYLFTTVASGTEVAIYAATSVAFAVAGCILLNRSGPARWLAAFVIFFACLCASAAFARRPETVYALLFLLASYPVALFSGLVLFLASRVPRGRRAGVLGGLTIAALLSTFLSPYSLSGSSWLVLAEAVLAIVLGGAGWWLLLGEPSETYRERSAPEAFGRIGIDAGSVQDRGKAGAILRVAALSAACLGMNVALVASLPFAVQAASRGFWMSAQQVQIGLAACGVLGCAGIILLARRSDLVLERKWHATAPILIGGMANLVALHSTEPILAVSAFVVAYVAIWAAKPVFWTLAVAAGNKSSAVGVGFINAVASLAVFVAPVVAWASRSLTGTEAWGTVFVSLLPLAGGLLMTGCIRDVSRP